MTGEGRKADILRLMGRRATALSCKTCGQEVLQGGARP